MDWALGDGTLIPETVTGFKKCDETPHEADTGNLTSPNYPGNYDNYTDCRQVIKVSDGSKVRLTFTAFDIESTLNCMYDRVVVSPKTTIFHRFSTT